MNVSVVIAAWNAQGSIARAISSALGEPEVAEVVVVDDASTDRTIAMAEQACDGTGRLKVLRQPDNRGPAAARNRAITESAAPCIAILDSDDFFVPGRFAAFASPGAWDAVVDNIAFVGADSLSRFDLTQLLRFDGCLTSLDLDAFVEGNMVRPGKPRAELGFIKPVLRRAFLADNGLRYDETLRLGEDYILYAQMLAAGAAFRVTNRCGYVAVERPESLSGRHSADDLAALHAADMALLSRPGLQAHEKAAIERHAQQLADKIHYRRLLDRRRQQGMGSAVVAALQVPRRLPAVIAAYARDKSHGGIAPAAPPVRYLLG